MRYVSFLRNNGKSSYGILDAQRVLDLGGEARPRTLREALAADCLGALEPGESLALQEVTLLPPIPDPGKILCVGLNYAKHVAEMGREDRGYPAIFTRWADTLVADGQPLVRPRESERFDYEGELAVIIGRPARRVPRESAHACIAGYSVFHDGSVRDWQGHNIQFTPGKNFPATAGFGPALVTPGEVPDLSAAHVVTRLNGVVVQDQPVSDMIHDVAEIIAYCSTFTTLLPGDVIATGTPGGVGDKRQPPLYLKGGDSVEISIGAVGTLTNPVVDER